MDVIEIVALYLLNALPIILLGIPYFFIRKKLAGKIYLRVMLGVMVFYVVYWILPIIFQLGSTPIELEIQAGDDIGLGIGYIVAHIGSLLSLFAYYPLVTLPFIFFVAPFIAIIYVRNRLRKEIGTKSEKLKSLTYHVVDSPYKRVRTDLFKNDWSREKDIMKLLIVLLPISLYLLQVILKILQIKSVSITTGETALGWFIEILFVYLATFIFSLELLFSSQIALRGRYFGENIRQQTYKSLYTVGAPISILSIILFLVEDIGSFNLILYFFAYFIMASIIFVLFLKIFEPISLLIFIKIIDWWKNKKEKRKKMNRSNIYYGIVFACLAVFVFFIINNFVFGLTIQSIFADPNSITNSANFAVSGTVYLYESLGFDLLNILSFVALVVVSLFVAVLFLNFSLKYMKSTFLSITTYMPILIVLSVVFVTIGINAIINFSPEIYWITGQTSFTPIFGFNFYTLRTAAFDAELTGVLYILAIPYQTTQYIFNIIFWSLVIFYMKKNFKAKNIPIDEKHLEKVIFSSVPEFPSYDEYAKIKTRYLIIRSEDIDLKDFEQEREEVKALVKELETEQMLDKLKPDEEKEMQRFYFTLKYLYNNGLIDVLKQEFSYIFEKAEKQGLYIIYDDGRGIFDYNFSKEFQHDPGIISGMFSAITSFIKETTKSQELLKTIDHGDITILIEYGKRIFGALFIKGKQTSEVRSSLKELVTRFEAKYEDVLADWSGALIYFKEDNKLVESIFKD
ncbi:MAG: ABC transporter ATP-binding protein [Candidatus Lokiarchaeota archaeon]|nr:ABC transporter ATP-binding protein [Candidatus Lokiarchaeota archaeon]